MNLNDPLRHPFRLLASKSRAKKAVSTRCDRPESGNR
jgi:hypothetical protein